MMKLKPSKMLIMAFLILSSILSIQTHAEKSFQDTKTLGIKTASWYGPGFHGRKTANGEKYNMHAYTAAHRYLPFGTKLKVTCTTTGKSVIVRVNDRGPFHGNRALDLSKAAAQSIGLIDRGVDKVKIDIIH